jgi:hypothetical protein
MSDNGLHPPMDSLHLRPALPSPAVLAGAASGPSTPAGADAARRDPFPDHQAPTVRAASGASLPPRLQAVKARVLALASARTLDTEGASKVRAELEPLVQELEAHFAAHRPRDEVKLTQGAWKSLWYDDPNIDRDRGVFRLDRGQIYQVVRDGYYYNVSDNPVVLLGRRVGTAHSFLKGNYTIEDAATPARQGQPRLNVIDLEFDANRLRLGAIPRGQDLVAMVEAVDRGERATLPIPGPRGITGQLWNAYVDGDLRISRGQQDDDPGVTDLYILRRVTAAED